MQPTSHSLRSPSSAMGTRGLGGINPPFLRKDFCNLGIFPGSGTFFTHAPSPPPDTISFLRYAMSIFSDIKGSIELPIIFLRVLPWWSSVSHIKQRILFRAVNCVDHKPVPSQLEFSKLTSADNSFCLGLIY